MPDSLDAFVQGRLSMYFGRASEYQEITSKNPHLNFDVIEVPQIRGAKLKRTNAQFYSLVISKTSPNKTTAFEFIKYMTSSAAQNLLVEDSFMLSPLRSLLAESPDNPILEAMYKATIRAVSWLDPDPEKKLHNLQRYDRVCFIRKKRVGRSSPRR